MSTRKSVNREYELRHGRRAPTYTDIKDWVSLAPIPEPAKALYLFYRMHVNRKRGDGLVWPTQETAAEFLGLSRGDKVAPYQRALEDLGAIDATRTGQEDGRYLILVHEEPPPGYVGPVTLEEWYAQRDEALKGRFDRAQAKRDAQRTKVRQPADTPKTGDPTDTPKTGDPDTPSAGDPDTPSTGGKPNEPNHHEVNQGGSPSSPGLTVGGDVGAAEGEATQNGLVQRVLGIATHWTEKTLRDALQLPGVQSRPAPLVAAALVAMAEGRYGATASPRRLAGDGPWWADAQEQVRAAAPRARRPRPDLPAGPAPAPLTDEERALARRKFGRTPGDLARSGVR